MRARHILYTWDYHHGQATRVILGGLPPLPGATMLDKQKAFTRNWDHVRTSLMREPRGHRNMLGAVITDPVTPDGAVGMLFLSPHGFFEMCGDSTFSAVAALIDSGILPYDDPDGDMTVKVDTVAGRVNVRVQLQHGDPIKITFENVPSYDLGTIELELPETGDVRALLGYGGLTYAFVEAQDVGIPSLRDVDRDELLRLGTRLWQAARASTCLPSSLGPERVGESRAVDLVTLWELLEDARGTRVANFYAPHTYGRTPSGTGLSARTAIEVAAGRLKKGETFIHESLLGLRFIASPVTTDIPRADEGPPGCIPAITARSFLMGICQWLLHSEDPFQQGFIV